LITRLLPGKHTLIMIAFSAMQPLIAQQTTVRFEVASIHLNKSGERRYGVTPKGSRFTATNMTLFALVQWAYEMEEFRISGGPSWLKSDRFDIAADAAGTQSIAQFRLLLQQLLRDRFRLEVHRQSKDLAIYELTVAKGGAKLKEAKCVGVPGPANPCGGTSGSSRGNLIGRAVPMATLAKDLSGMLGRPVLDKTMLKGEYDFELTWTPDETSRRGPGDPDAPPASADGPSLFTAIQEQLGLALKSGKGVIDVLIVDQAELPTEN
jgi:uncharacterized protein (TIGR03435 family)